MYLGAPQIIFGVKLYRYIKPTYSPKLFENILCNYFRCEINFVSIIITFDAL